jgi:hypothetical protein
MKITMKNMVSVAMAALLTLALGLAYAADDQMPDFNANKNTGTELYEAFPKHDGGVGIGSAAGGQRADAVIRAGEYTSDELPVFSSHRDIGSELRVAHLKQEAMKNSAAGGVRVIGPDRSDEYTSDTLPTWNQKR